MAPAAAGPVHILGAGSIGLLFGEALVSKGIPCTLILRNQAKLAALAAAKGKVTIERHNVNNGSSILRNAYNVTADVAEQIRPSCSIDGPSSVDGTTGIRRLVVTTKANHAVAALASVKHRLSNDSVVLLLTNGVLGVYMDVVRMLFPPGGTGQHPAFLLGMTTHGAYRKGDFQVVHAGRGSFVAGLPSQDILESAAAAALTQAAGTMSRKSPCSISNSSCTAVATPPQQHQHQQPAEGNAVPLAQPPPLQQQQQQQHIQEMLSVLGSLETLQPNTSLSAEQLHTQLLLKLVINCCSNPLSGLLHCRNGGLPGNPHVEAVWRHVVHECKAVFGDKMPGSEAELLEQVAHVVRINGRNYNSMLQDVIKHVPSEVDYLNGFVLQQGAAAGVATPWNEMLAMLMRARTCVPHGMLTTELL